MSKYLNTCNSSEIRLDDFIINLQQKKKPIIKQREHNNNNNKIDTNIIYVDRHGTVEQQQQPQPKSKQVNINF